MKKVNKEVATSDIEKFLNALRVDPLKRKKIDSLIQECIELVEYGMLVVTEDNELKYPLLEAITDIDGKVVISELLFKNKRVRIDSLEGIKSATEETYMRKLLTIMTSEDATVLKKLTLDDMYYLEKISQFFLPAQ